MMISSTIFASNIIPVGNENNAFYYKIGGGSDFALPPISDTNKITLDTNTNLGMGNSCGSYNPAISISNSINSLKDSVDNLKKDIIMNATASVILMPGYELAKRNPSLYALLNNHLLASHKELELSTRSCEAMKEKISRGENPYEDWGTISVNDQWKKKLSLTAIDKEDINHAKKDIDKTSGNSGVYWVNGVKDSDGSLRAGGKNQPSVRVIADTIKAGYNAMLNRDLQNDSPAPSTGSSSGLAHYFPNPAAAVNWVTMVLGDQMITTCKDDDCKRKQGSVVGHGLLTSVTSCSQDQENCADTIREHFGNLVTGHEVITKENIDRVSADGVAMSPDVIAAIRNMDSSQQKMIINKLSQEIAIQRTIDKALIARNLLATGAQVPVISANHPAQVMIARAITNLDNDIRSIVFEGQIRKQMVSETLSQVIHFSYQQQQNAMQIPTTSAPTSVMDNGAIQTSKEVHS